MGIVWQSQVGASVLLVNSTSALYCLCNLLYRLYRLLYILLLFQFKFGWGILIRKMRLIMLSSVSFLLDQVCQGIIYFERCEIY